MIFLIFSILIFHLRLRKLFVYKDPLLTLNIRRQVSWFFQNIIFSFHSSNIYEVTVVTFLLDPLHSLSSSTMCGSLFSHGSKKCFLGEHISSSEITKRSQLRKINLSNRLYNFLVRKFNTIFAR